VLYCCRIGLEVCWKLESQFTARLLITAAAGEYDDRNSALRRHFSISQNRIGHHTSTHTHTGWYGEDMNRRMRQTVIRSKVTVVTAERQKQE